MTLTQSDLDERDPSKMLWVLMMCKLGRIVVADEDIRVWMNVTHRMPSQMKDQVHEHLNSR